jgi:hypothetical protein
MNALKQRRKLWIPIVACVLLVAIALTALFLYLFRDDDSDGAIPDGDHDVFTAGMRETGFLRLYVPREMQLHKSPGDFWRTSIYGPIHGPKNVGILIEQENVDHLSTVEREGHLEVYATDLMKRMDLLGKCELQGSGDLLFFEYEKMTVYDIYSDNPQPYMEYGMIAVYRAPGHQGHLHFRCHADDKNTYRAQFLEIASSLEFIG